MTYPKKGSAGVQSHSFLNSVHVCRATKNRPNVDQTKTNDQRRPHQTKDQTHTKKRKFADSIVVVDKKQQLQRQAKVHNSNQAPIYIPSFCCLDSGTMSSINTATFAKKRLLRDLKELHNETTDHIRNTVSALPTNNIFEWHCNLRPDYGPYAGTIFHVVLYFPQDYPTTPPRVGLCTSLSHPNVFNWNGNPDYENEVFPYICLDMLQAYYTNEPYVGWSSAYSVASVLLQLQSFLFAENVPQDWGGTAKATVSHKSIKAAILRAHDFSCETIDMDGDKVKHTHEKPWPPLPPYTGNDVHRSRRNRASAGWAKLQVEADPKIRVIPRGSEALSTPKQIEEFVYCEENFPALGGVEPERDEVKQIEDSFGKYLSIASTGTESTLEVDIQPKRSTSLLCLAEEHAEDRGNCYALEIPSAVYTHIFGYLNPTELCKSRDVCSLWRKVVFTYNLFERSQITCFHTKANLDDESCVLGVGLDVEFYQKRRGQLQPALKEATSPLDILSLDAFENQGVRTGVWGKEKFSHFLPLILTPSHGKKAVPIIERNVREIMGTCHNSMTFEPRMVLQLLSTLMNSMVVQLMKDVERGGDETIRRHASEKALEGYCAFHHMLLHFARRYPSIHKLANDQIEQFLQRSYTRHKTYTPNLGTLLICLTLSRKGWSSMWKPLMIETFDRQVRWLLQKHPELSSRVSADCRINKHFNGAMTSNRLLMFQVFFMARIGRPAGTRGPFDVLSRYEKRLGRPTTAQKEDLQNACREILAVKTWNQFLERCDAPLPTKAKLNGMLEQAVINSQNKGYHHDKKSDNFSHHRPRRQRQCLNLGKI